LESRTRFIEVHAAALPVPSEKTTMLRPSAGEFPQQTRHPYPTRSAKIEWVRVMILLAAVTSTMTA